MRSRTSFQLAARTYGLALSAVVLASSRGADADTLVVDAVGGGTYTAIQAAIDAASNGDEIIVQPGTYFERINFLGKAIHVRSADPADPSIVTATVIDGQDLGRVVTFAAAEPGQSILEGLTITNGSDAGPAGGAGVYCANGAEPTISRNRIIANYSVLHGAGVHCAAGTQPVLVENTICDNVAEGRGGGVYVVGSAAQLVGNAIERNLAGCSSGGGVYLGPGANGSVVIDNRIADNQATFGGGVHIDGCSPRLERNRIVRNLGNPRGGGLSCVAGSPLIIGNVIAGNRAGIAAAIECNQGAPILRSNTIVDNQADQSAVILAIDGAAVTLEGNIIAFHPAAGAFALHAVAPATITVDHCCLHGNAGGNTAGPVTLGTHNLFADPRLVAGGQWIGQPVVGPICGGQVSYFAVLDGSGPETGSVDYRYGPVGARFRVDIDGFTPGPYEVTAAGIVVGQITADSRGRGDLRYDSVEGTWPPGFPLLALADVIDISGQAAGGLQTVAPVMPTSFSEGDIHLQPGSPCINAFSGPVEPNAMDIDGQPRTSGGAPDIGADEHVATPTGDADGDGDRDLFDLLRLQSCVPSAQPLPFPCAVFDANADQFIDAADWSLLVGALTGPA